MRRKIVAANWKMSLNFKEGIQLAKDVTKLIKEKVNNDVEIILAPPFLYMTEIAKIIDEKSIKLSAQNCSMHNNGAYTGEVSASMISSIDIGYTIVGHSERREYQQEDNTKVLEKIKRSLENNIKPIVCIGEKLDERVAGNHFNIVEEQLEECIYNLTMNEFCNNIIIAYEPVWAIGTGKNATPEEVQEMHAYIREILLNRFGEDIAESTSIIYGGSIKPANAKELFAQEDVDGGLIGGAALDAKSFAEIINLL